MKLKLEELDVLPAHSGRMRCESNWRLDKKWGKALRDYDLWYIWAGRGRMKTGSGQVDLYPGRALWLRPGRTYEAEQNLDDRLGVTFVHFLLKKGKRVLSPSGFVPPGEVFEVKNPEYFDVAVSHAAQLAAGPLSAGVASQLIKSLLMELVNDARRDDTVNPSARHHQEEVARSIAYIHANADKPPTVHELARHAGYSCDHFARIFRRTTGLFPKEFILRDRMERAIVLLRESSQTVTQISDALGYEDVGFFSKQFKKKIGSSPKDFRQGKVRASRGRRRQGGL